MLNQTEAMLNQAEHKLSCAEYLLSLLFQLKVNKSYFLSGEEVSAVIELTSEGVLNSVM
jgi:hypothetical protein